MRNKIKAFLNIITKLGQSKNEFLEKITKLWQSKNEDYKEMKLAGICLFIFSIVCFVFAYFSNNEWESLNTIVKYSANYTGFLTMLTAICFLISHWYIYNDNTRIKKCAKFFIPIIIITIIIIIMMIPLILPLTFIGKALNYRAKKMDNLINFLVFFLIVMFCITILLSLNFSTAYYFSGFLENILKLKCNFNLDTSPTSIFILISLIKLEIDIISSCLIYLKKKESNKKMQLRLKKIKENFDKNISMPNLNTENYMQEKSDKLRMLEDELKKDIDCDIKYLKNTFRKSELAILIIIFMLIIFKAVPYDILENLENYQSDIINVLTLYTLAMLYIDKRKEWK